MKNASIRVNVEKQIPNVGLRLFCMTTDVRLRSGLTRTVFFYFLWSIFFDSLWKMEKKKSAHGLKEEDTLGGILFLRL